MSYEGYEQHICVAGHRFNTNGPWDDPEPTCRATTITPDGAVHVCGEPSAFFNCVDETNCDGVGLILEESWKLL